MLGNNTCYILILEKVVAFKAARLKTLVITIVKMMAARWFSGMRMAYVIMDAITSFRIKSQTYSLWVGILRMNLRVLSVQNRVLIAKWAPTTIVNG